MEFSFTLTYAVPTEGHDASQLEAALLQAGCDDGLLGSGREGRVALAFCREARTARQALSSALRHVQQALPAAELIEVAPGRDGLTDAAALLGTNWPKRPRR